MVVESLQGAAEKLAQLRTNLQTVILGKDESIDVLIISLLAGGSVLLEDIPGVGKIGTVTYFKRRNR